MARIIGIDYGTRRVGLAVTDPLQIIAGGLDTVPTETVIAYLKKYLETEEVERFVVGFPLHEDGSPAQIAPRVKSFVAELNQHFPDIEVIFEDERFTSKEAKKIILASGAKKKKRQNKALVDKISAVLILQSYMERH